MRQDFPANPRIYVAESLLKGRGVFAGERICEGTVIERAHVVVLCERDKPTMDPNSRIDPYLFCWGPDLGGLALALGNACLYNHSYLPNAIYHPDLDANLLVFVARRNIEVNEEILINYNRDPVCLDPLWFPVAD